MQARSFSSSPQVTFCSVPPQIDSEEDAEAFKTRLSEPHSGAFPQPGNSEVETAAPPDTITPDQHVSAEGFQQNERTHAQTTQIHAMDKYDRDIRYEGDVISVVKKAYEFKIKFKQTL